MPQSGPESKRSTINGTRAAPRSQVHLPLRLWLDEQQPALDAVALNFSRSGMFVEMEPLPPCGTQLTIEVVLADGHQVLRAPAEVVRHQAAGPARGMGVRFLRLAAAEQQLLDRLVANEALLGRFQLEALIGMGGMAEVYRATVLHGPFTGRTVALKRILPELGHDPAFVRAFAIEAELSQQLSHPNIVNVLESGTAGHSYYIAMEYVEGGTLSQLLALCRQQRQPLPLPLALGIIVRVARALDFAHGLCAPDGTQYGLVHRDVSPDNILISYAGETKLTDFGVVHLAATTTSEEKTKVLAGKAPYLAPEQVRRQPVSAATDVFALGAVMYEALTSQMAFAGSSPREIRRRILAGRVDVPSCVRPELPSAVDALVARALSSRSPRRSSWDLRAWWGWPRPPRFASAAELLTAIGQLGCEASSHEAQLQQFVQRLMAGAPREGSAPVG